MNLDKEYLKKNRELWNNKVETHVQSSFYDVAGFLEGNTSLNSIELSLLGNVKGKSILHLQCHFGLDTLSLARMGAEVTGVDFAEKAINQARYLAEEASLKGRFICSDIYDLPNHLNEQFDIVFTSYGTIGWLPDIKKWSEVVAKFLKPQGTFVFAEFHPVVWMFDEDFKNIGYDYFNTSPIVETEEGTYADRTAPITHEFISWNHPLGEVLGHLIGSGFKISMFQEFDYSPYNCFKNMIEVAPKQFRIAHLDHKIPMTYALKAIKKG